VMDYGLAGDKSYMPLWSSRTCYRTPESGCGPGLLIDARERGGGQRGQRRARAHLANDAAGRNIAGRGEGRSSPKTRMTRSATASSAEARKKSLGFGVRVQSEGVNCGVVRR
jgi:hypothetical protein